MTHTWLTSLPTGKMSSEIWPTLHMIMYTCTFTQLYSAGHLLLLGATAAIHHNLTRKTGTIITLQSVTHTKVRHVHVYACGQYTCTQEIPQQTNASDCGMFVCQVRTVHSGCTNKDVLYAGIHTHDQYNNSYC